MAKKILLVEDDSFLLDIYSTKLRDAGFEVDTAMDGEDCLKMLKENIPDLLLLDIVLPSIDGWELLAKIKKNKKTKDLKVVILSNLGNKEEVERGARLGAIKYIIKAQHTPSEVAEQIKEILN